MLPEMLPAPTTHSLVRFDHTPHMSLNPYSSLIARRNAAKIGFWFASPLGVHCNSLLFDLRGE